MNASASSSETVIIYRVFLLPGSFESDCALTPASQFGAGGPNFRLSFGEVVEQPFELPPTSEHELFGYAVHHTLHARVAIERDRYWLAEYWISAVRDYALNLACLHRGLDGWYGRDLDRPRVMSSNGSRIGSFDRWSQMNSVVRCATSSRHFLTSPVMCMTWRTK